MIEEKAEMDSHMKDLRHLLLYTALTNSIRVAVFKFPDREGKCMSYPCFERIFRQQFLSN